MPFPTEYYVDRDGGRVDNAVSDKILGVIIRVYRGDQVLDEYKKAEDAAAASIQFRGRTRRRSRRKGQHRDQRTAILNRSAAIHQTGVECRPNPVGSGGRKGENSGGGGLSKARALPGGGMREREPPGGVQGGGSFTG
ncbi:MAG: hypothetical protein H7A53_10150 [Akkermansiaceae bacterium]|nr:hypothetical protein [Akkermansiaceae bacterium]